MGNAAPPNSIAAFARRSVIAVPVGERCAIRTLTIRRIKIFWLDLLNL